MALFDVSWEFIAGLALSLGGAVLKDMAEDKQNKRLIEAEVAKQLSEQQKKKGKKA